jgi:predicted ATPase/class 3 adenylate cyclase
MSGLPTGTVTFLFTDVEGSTRLVAALGTEYPAVLERHSAIVREGLSAHGGVEVNTEGDSFFAVFGSAVDAVGAVVEIQRALAAEPWPAGNSVRVRMGVHTGEGRVALADYAGMDVHVAARIAAAGHGGQVLLSDATRALVAATLPAGVTLRDLGTHRLKDLEEPQALWQLVIDGLEAAFPPIRTLESPTNLPAEHTSFVGRAQETDDVLALLSTNRLVTLTGPGGTGKTRLALRIADSCRSRFADGTFFIDLAPLTDPALVGPTIARSMGLSDQAERTIVDLLTAYLERREMLLVLDNFEHLLAGSAIVERLLSGAPTLRILVTSRSALELYGEQEYAVPPLPLPDPADVADLARLSANEAVALFVERARAATPAFALSRETAAAIARICVRLDGLPLAIELAASRIRLLEPAEILARLEQQLPVLSTGGSNLPERQRTLRAAIAWSYDLLRPGEQAFFARLAIFSGGWTLDAAEAVSLPRETADLDAFEGLASLVAQSLVRRSSDAGGSRFAMFETIREFAHHRLQEDGDVEEVGRRHLAYYRDLAETAEPHFIGSDQVAWLDRFEREHDNVRAALGRALVERDVENGLRLAGSLWRFWLQRGFLREGRGWLEAILALEPDAVDRSRAKAFSALGGLCYWLNDIDATEEAYRSAVRLYRVLGDRAAEAEALYDFAFVPVMRGEHGEAQRRFDEVLSVAREVGRRDLVAKVQMSRGINAVLARDAAAALVLFDESLAYFREIDDRFHVADALAAVAQAYRLLRDHRAARHAYSEALRIFAEARNLPSIGMVLEETAALESSAGRHAEAVRLMGAAASLRDTTGATAPLTVMRLGDVEATARVAIGDQAVDEALGAGRRMTLEQAIEYATGLAGSRPA